MKLGQLDFRIWDDKSKKYLENTPSLFYHLSNRIYKDKENAYKNLKIEFFTGLNDKNGKKIYEADVIRLENQHFLIMVSLTQGVLAMPCLKRYGKTYIKLPYKSYKNAEIVANLHYDIHFKIPISERFICNFKFKNANI